ncbi:MAG: hypothetical protein ACK5LR_06885 [Mangrovibacterium sp.]
MKNWAERHDEQRQLVPMSASECQRIEKLVMVWEFGVLFVWSMNLLIKS